MPRPESSAPPKSTIIARNTIALDALPMDEEQSMVTKNYKKFAEFLAYIREARVTVAGELHITIGVPYEHKYDAIGLTDMRGVMFIMQCHRPLSEEEMEIEWTTDDDR